MLRALVFALAVLAGAKVWTQNHMFHVGATDALLLAYGERAMAACQSTGSGVALWTRPAAVDVSIGRSGVDVQIWELASERWPARFKHPHVVLTLAGAVPATCQYDVIEGRAYLAQM